VVIVTFAQHPLSPTARKRGMLPKKGPAFTSVFPCAPPENKRADYQQTYLRQRQPDTQGLRIEGNQGPEDDKENCQVPKGFRTAPRAAA
jgi:hypothetical protein